MKPISNEKRELIITARNRGEKIRVIAEWMKVSLSSVNSLIRLNKETGAIMPKPYMGRKPKISDEQIASIREHVKNNPDATLDEIIDELCLPIKKSRLSVILINMGMTFKKKTLFPSGQNREDVREKRRLWQENQNKIDTKRAFFLDQSSVNLGMTRLYGRAPKNARLVEYVPDVRFERTSIMGALGLNGVIAPMTFKGTLDGNFFAGYVEQFLAPCLSPGDIVFMDNLSSHKVSGVLDPIYERGADVVFLPEYSPDLNPIELMWSKLKSVLRKLKARTIDELEKAICNALESITSNDIIGWFEHHGYSVDL